MRKSKNSGQRSRICKILYICGGVFSFVLGTAGAFLPILPTVPFYLLATFCFAKSSPELLRKIEGTKIYGKHCKRFADGYGMTMKSKVSINLFVWALMIAMFFSVPGIFLKILAVCLAATQTVAFIIIKTDKGVRKENQKNSPMKSVKTKTRIENTADDKVA